ncbi:hypothetical protein ACIO7M_33290 [Streptomyces toxytricini]|uniref:Uncharacterized protein n=1 Tax=Streptomyces toxytricini TaxID=67369 RepID=A0ABW8ETJ5_STRT5
MDDLHEEMLAADFDTTEAPGSRCSPTPKPGDPHKTAQSYAAAVTLASLLMWA